MNDIVSLYKESKIELAMILKKSGKFNEIMSQC